MEVGAATSVSWPTRMPVWTLSGRTVKRDYNAVAEIGLTGVDAGTLAIDGNVDVNIPFLGDTLQVRGDAFFHRSKLS